MGRGKDCLLWIDIRLTSLTPSSCWAGECLTLPSQSRIIIALIQISRRLVIFFFHLMTCDMDCAFIHGFIVKQACFMPWHSDSFLVCVCALCRSVMFNSLQSHGLYPSKILCPWNFPGKNTGAGCHFLLQGIFPTQGLKLHLLDLHFCVCTNRQILYPVPLEKLSWGYH